MSCKKEMKEIERNKRNQEFKIRFKGLLLIRIFYYKHYDFVEFKK